MAEQRVVVRGTHQLGRRSVVLAGDVRVKPSFLMCGVKQHRPYSDYTTLLIFHVWISPWHHNVGEMTMEGFPR